MPLPAPSIKTENGIRYIQCPVRKKWVVLTPEEKVRQFTIHQLCGAYAYPLKYISVEKTLKVNELSKRYDVVVYNRQLQPSVLIECKAEHVPLSDKTLQQIATYNITMQVTYLMVTNGKNSYCFEIKDNAPHPLEMLPDFERL